MGYHFHNQQHSCRVSPEPATFIPKTKTCLRAEMLLQHQESTCFYLDKVHQPGSWARSPSWAVQKHSTLRDLYLLFLLIIFHQTCQLPYFSALSTVFHKRHFSKELWLAVLYKRVINGSKLVLLVINRSWYCSEFDARKKLSYIFTCACMNEQGKYSRDEQIFVIRRWVNSSQGKFHSVHALWSDLAPEVVEINV